MLAFHSNYNALEFLSHELNKRFFLGEKENVSITEMNGTNDLEFLRVDFQIVHVALKHDLRKQVLPDLPFSLDDVVLLFDLSFCFLFNLVREIDPILLVGQKNKQVWIVLFA